MPTYPIALIPDRIQRAKNAEPPEPIFTAIAPTKPIDTPQPYEKKTLITESVIAFLVCVVFLVINPVLWIIAFFGSIGAIAYHAWIMQQSFPSRKRKFDDALRSYPKLFKKYQQTKSEHDVEVKRVRNPENVAKYRKNQLLLALKQTDPNDGGNTKAQEGFSEAKFYNHLSKYFQGKIHRGLTLTIPNYEYPYSPDFAYIDRSTSLYINIEIDEPYVYKNGKPSHFVGRDDRRNNFFLGKNWVVLRFAEEQVVRYPQGCCKEVAKVIANVLGDNLELIQFNDVPDLPLIRQWTESEALEMAKQQYRQDYLDNRLVG